MSRTTNTIAVPVHVAASRPAGGNVFRDLHNDSLWESNHPGVPGMLVFADYNRNGIADLSEPTTLSNAAGDFELRGVAPGSTALGVLHPLSEATSLPSTDLFTARMLDQALLAGGSNGSLSVLATDGSEVLAAGMSSDDILSRFLLKTLDFTI